VVVHSVVPAPRLASSILNSVSAAGCDFVGPSVGSERVDRNVNSEEGDAGEEQDKIIPMRGRQCEGVILDSGWKDVSVVRLHRNTFTPLFNANALT
jgi:hypothetical protein